MTQTLIRVINISIMLAGFLSCLYGVLQIVITNSLEKEGRRIGAQAFASLFLYISSDFVVQIISGMPGEAVHIVLVVASYLEFILGSLLVFNAANLIRYYLGIYKHSDHRFRLMQAGMLTQIVLLTVNLFTGFIYTIGADNFFHRSEGYPLFIAMPALMMMIAFSYRIDRKDALSRKQIFAIDVCLVMLTIAGALEMVLGGIKVMIFAAILCSMALSILMLEKQKEKMIGIQQHIISELANLIENRDVETGEHVARTSKYVQILSEAARKDGVYTEIIDEHFINMMKDFAPLHDIGKIVVSDTILKKPEKLTPDEYEMMKEHAYAGGIIVRDILEGITEEENIRFAQDIAMYHHEWWDGRGYHEGLAGEDIPLCARIMAIADVFDALTAERCYKDAMSAEEAFEVFRAEQGTHFDPVLTKVFLDHGKEFADVVK